MSKYNLEKVLRKELEVLNDQIDQRIIRGLSYSRHARRHRFILTQLAQIRRARTTNWFSRSFVSIS